MRVETPLEPVDGVRRDALVAPVPGAGPPLVTARLAETAGIGIAAIAARRGLRSPADSTWIQADTAFGCPDLLLVCVARGAEVSAEELRLDAVAWEGYRKDIRTEVAELRNHQFGMVWRQQAIWTALYLSEFVGSTPWAHLDTAATVFRAEPDDLWPIGATGSGTRTLIEFLRADADTTDADTSGSKPA